MNCPYCSTELKVIELEYPETDDILDTVVVTVWGECPKCKRDFSWKTKYTNPETFWFVEPYII